MCCLISVKRVPLLPQPELKRQRFSGSGMVVMSRVGRQIGRMKSGNNEVFVVVLFLDFVLFHDGKAQYV